MKNIIELIIELLKVIKRYLKGGTQTNDQNGTMTPPEQETPEEEAETEPQEAIHPQYPQDYVNITSGWGKRSFMLNGKPYSDFHYGIDAIGNNTKVGDRIKAVLDGEVIEIRTNQYKTTIMIIRHKVNSAGDGLCWLSKYCHWVNPRVKVGDKVKQGQWIADEGAEGKYVTGPHLHFELWRSWNYRTNEDILKLDSKGMALNPLPHLRVAPHQTIIPTTKFKDEIREE